MRKTPQTGSRRQYINVSWIPSMSDYDSLDVDFPAWATVKPGTSTVRAVKNAIERKTGGRLTRMVPITSGIVGERWFFTMLKRAGHPPFRFRIHLA